MKKNKLKMAALVASSALAIQATNLLSSPFSANALHFNALMTRVGSGIKNIVTNESVINGVLLGTIAVSSVGIGISAMSIVNQKHNDRMEQKRNSQSEKDKNNEDKNKGFTPSVINTN